MKFNLGRFRYLATTAGIGLLLAGCGGGGSPTASTLGGTAAVGFPIVGGTINVRCAAGSAISPVTTNNTGDWQVTVSGQTLPCAVQVSGGTINGAANSTPYHSIATALGTVNVTTLTDLMVAHLAGAATPGTWFDGLATTPTPLTAITQANVDTALVNLRAALSGLAPLGTLNPITTAFTASPGNTSDDMLAALRTAMTSASITYATLLSNASATTFTVPAGFGTALTFAYQGMTGGSAGSGGGSGSGNYTLTVSVTASGIASPAITISNVPKPATQTDFCGDVAVTSALTGAATGGTLTINSCTFDGTVGMGSISATVSITTPVSATIPYTVNYSYAANGGGTTGGGGAVTTCASAHYSVPVHAPTTAELATYAKTYTGNKGSFGPNPGDPFVASGSASFVLSAAGGLTYNGATKLVTSMCLENTPTGSALLYVEMQPSDGVDFFADGGFTGTIANGASFDVVQGGSCTTACGTGGTSGGTGGGSGATSGSVTTAFPTNMAGHLLLSYSSGPNIGIDLRTPGTQALRVTLDSAGGLSGYDTQPGCTPAANCENMLIGTNSVAELGGNANITWGRWNGGTTAGSYYNYLGGTYTFSNTQGFHYVLGVKGEALPTTGTVTYALSGTTQPTVGSGGVGTFAGSVKVDYATNKVGVDFTVTMPDHAYRILSNGGLTTLTNSELALDRTSFPTPPVITGSIPMPQGGTACPNASGCNAVFDGMVVSAAASGTYQVGGTYMIFTGSPGAGSVHGAAVFQ